jgi:16S rRNA (cytosine967-C5)-methyltransferase
MAREQRDKQQHRRPHPRTVHDLDPRQAAFDTLRRLKPGDLIEPAVLDTLRHEGRDRRAANRIVPMLEDAVRFATLFDHLISQLSSRPVHELDTDVRVALHLFLAWYIHDPGAAYAHGNAAVNLLSDKHSGRGFTNALVRKLSQLVEVTNPGPEDYRQAAANHQPLPLWADRCRVGQGRVLKAKHAILPDPARELAAHLAVAGSLPREFVDRCLEQHGEVAAIQIALAAIERPATWLRPNPLVTDALGIEVGWRQLGVPCERVKLAHGEAIAVPVQDSDITAHPDFGRGGFYVQDYSAQLVAPMLQPQAEQVLLDLCAAPGGKSGHLAELTGDKARILACDLTEPKLERITANLARMGYHSIATVMADAAEIKFPEPFDGVLIDAPCSNSGVLARRVEARHRVHDAGLKDLIALQARILENAARNVKPGGAVVYSVCSVLMEESVDVVHRFLGKHDGWDIEAEEITLPVPAWHDGGYACRLRAP